MWRKIRHAVAALGLAAVTSGSNFRQFRHHHF
jgi:hypothetical protein